MAVASANSCERVVMRLKDAFRQRQEVAGSQYPASRFLRHIADRRARASTTAIEQADREVVGPLPV